MKQVVPNAAFLSSRPTLQSKAHGNTRRVVETGARPSAVEKTGRAAVARPVFQPYAGVKTSALIFRKGDSIERVLFLHADHHSYKLDANHDTPIAEDDLPSLVAAFKDRHACWKDWESRDTKAEWEERWWLADVGALRANDFNLSAGRYRPMNQAKIEHQDPRLILDELAPIRK